MVVDTGNHARYLFVNTIFVTYHPHEDTRILEGDRVALFGQSFGLITYESDSGSRTVPRIYAQSRPTHPRIFPKGHLLPHATQQTPSLFDHLVGAHQKRLWDRQAESFGGVKIDDEFEVSRLLDREVFRLGAAEDLDKHTRPLPIDRYKTRAVCDQPTLFRHFSSHSLNRGKVGAELRPPR